MSLPNAIWLGVMAVVFLAWAVCMFQMLWQMTRRSADRLNETGGGYFTWAGHSLSSFFAFFRAPEYRAQRRRLLILTLLMIAIIVARPFLLEKISG